MKKIVVLLMLLVLAGCGQSQMKPEKPAAYPDFSTPEKTLANQGQNQGRQNQGQLY